jgi:hypothetical protein
MAGTYKQPQQVTEWVESELRRMARKPQGHLAVDRVLVHKLRNSGAARTHIGSHRADKLWGAVATLVVNNQLKVNPTMTELEARALQERARAAWGPSPKTRDPRVSSVEMTSAVLTWLHEHDELAPGQSMFSVRPGKLTQLKNARKKTAQPRGGPMAIMAAIVLLSADGLAVLEHIPNRAQNRRSWDTWITDVVQWMVHQGWATDSEAEKVSAAALARHSHHSNAAPSLRILNLGEGWRSVGWKLKQLKGTEVHITGVDRRGFLYTGTVQGTITAEIKHDWLDQKTDLLTALSKKASTSVRRWDLVTLEPECTLLSKANARNQTIGAAHGKWAETALNKKNAHPDRLEQERKDYKEALQGIQTQLDTLKANPTVPFTMENPWDSEL